MTRPLVYLPTADWHEIPSTPLADLATLKAANRDRQWVLPEGPPLPDLIPHGHVLLSGYDHDGESAVFITPANVGNRRTYRAARQGNFAKCRYHLLRHCERRVARRG
jgi:hypothetical protein